MIPRLVAFAFVVFFASVASFAQEAEAVEAIETETATEDATTFYVIPVVEQISQPTLYAIRNGVKTAIEQEYDYVVLDMKTPGGRLDVTLEILEILDRFPGKTITYVNDEATSAGAIIAAVTNQIYFAPRGTMGSAEVVTGNGEDVNESMKRKIGSFMNSKLDAYTDQYPYRSDVIKAMMDPDFEFKIGEEVISPEGKLLNLNAKTAHEEYGDPPQPILGSGIVDDLDSLLDSLALGGSKTVERFEPTWSLQLAHFIVMIAPLLFAVGVITVYMEFQIPGFGVFGIIGVVCFLIFFFGHTVAGLSGQEPMLLFFLGLVFLALEIFVAPGTLFFAIIGVVTIVASILWSMVDVWPENTPDFSWNMDMLIKPMQNVMIGVALGIVAILLIARFIPKSILWNRLILSDVVKGSSQDGSAVSVASGLSAGTLGVASSDLVPSGEIEVEGRIYEARLLYGMANRGASVRVVEKTDFGYIVEETES